uniref:Uncharacterized protein n=1 Tax=Salix viminalis TaxID=40686 RepID=A0A6N2NF68_SALVM
MGLGSLRFGLDLVVISVFVRRSEESGRVWRVARKHKKKGRKEESGADGGEVFQAGFTTANLGLMSFTQDSKLVMDLQPSSSTIKQRY